MDEPSHDRQGVVFQGERWSRRYFITFACYGGHLHGGTVDRDHNLPGSPLLPANPKLAAAARQLMDQSPYLLDLSSRAIVLGALREVCLHRGWVLFAAHVRTNHVHVIVEAEAGPEKVMNNFKSYASRLFEPRRIGRTKPQALGSPREHAMALERRGCAASD